MAFGYCLHFNTVLTLIANILKLAVMPFIVFWIGFCSTGNSKDFFKENERNEVKIALFCKPMLSKSSRWETIGKIGLNWDF